MSWTRPPGPTLFSAALPRNMTGNRVSTVCSCRGQLPPSTRNFVESYFWGAIITPWALLGEASRRRAQGCNSSYIEECPHLGNIPKKKDFWLLRSCGSFSERILLFLLKNKIVNIQPHHPLPFLAMSEIWKHLEQPPFPYSFIAMGCRKTTTGTLPKPFFLLASVMESQISILTKKRLVLLGLLRCISLKYA